MNVWDEVFILLRALRINQWTKNAIVFAAFIFALGAHEEALSLSAFWIVLQAAVLFSLASSGVYLINDIKDREYDRSHPLKKTRPVASGALPIRRALVVSLFLLGIGLGGSWLLSPSFFYVLGSYVVVQVLYTFALKAIALIDVFVIAAGFVLRALAGAVVLKVPISPWLLLCTLLLALFLALCKRRHEKMVYERWAKATRPTLERYHEKLLDQLIAVVSSATIVSYALYTLWPDTVGKFGTTRLGFTIPFVIFGLFRYLDLVYRHEEGGRPERILLTDIPLMVDLALYGLSIILILFIL